MGSSVPHWVTTWVSAQMLTESDNMPPEPGLAGNTLRQVVRVSVGGSKVRFSFSNEYGHEPLTISGASVARSDGFDVIDSRNCARCTFGGRSCVTVPPAERVQSDPVELTVSPLTNLTLTTHFESTPSAVTGHPGSRMTSFLQPGEALVTAALPAAVPIEHWYFLCDVDVWTSEAQKSVITLGDSITDGRGSTTDGNDRWPNHLSRRLLGRGSLQIPVLNQGIGGNRVLSEGLGPSALTRFKRDVLDIDDVGWVIVFEGINDIGTAEPEHVRPESSATPFELISAYERMIAWAHERKIRVYGATLMPFDGSFYFSAERESYRQRVNAFIRSGAFDAVIDFDAIAGDPQNPSRLSAALDGGDSLHPSVEGHRILGESVNLSLFD